MRFFYFLFFIFLVKISSAQVVFSVEVASDTMQIGDVNFYRLKVAHPENVTIRSIDLKPLQRDAFITEEDAFKNTPRDSARIAKDETYFDTAGFIQVNPSYYPNGVKDASKQYDQELRSKGYSREIMEINNYGKWKAPDESMMLTGSEADWKTQKNGNQISKENDIQFTFWEEGIHKILPPVIEYEQNGQLKTIVGNEIIAVGVNSPLPSYIVIDSTIIEPIKTIREEPIDFFQDFLIPAGLFILGFLIIGGIIYYFVKRANRPKVAIPKPKAFVPANVIAINQLEELKGKQLWQKGDIKTYQSELTHIIRAYLENRYKINALENTTNQISQDLKKLKLNGSLRNEVQNILQVADLVKFAKAQPADDIHEQFMNKAFEFVQTTKKNNTEVLAEKTAIENEYLEKVNQLKNPNSNSNTVSYPSRWLRLFANFFDSVIFFILYFLPFFVLVFARDIFNFESEFLTGILYEIVKVSVVLLNFAFYYGYMESKKGFTLGKKITGIRIQNIDGSNISFLKSFLRFILKIISIVLFGLPYLTMFFTKRRQTFYDILLKTEIVRITRKKKSQHFETINMTDSK